MVMLAGMSGLYYSGLIFVARTTLPHFSVSSAKSLPKSEGEPTKSEEPKTASCAFSFASTRPALISLLSLLTISAGVFLGADDAEESACLVARKEVVHSRNVW
jgi:hypothetical protein